MPDDSIKSAGLGAIHLQVTGDYQLNITPNAEPLSFCSSGNFVIWKNCSTNCVGEHGGRQRT